MPDHMPIASDKTNRRSANHSTAAVFVTGATAVSCHLPSVVDGIDCASAGGQVSSGGRIPMSSGIARSIV